jgi:hypothetical protein
MQPRVRTPFDGDIDSATVTSRSLFFVNIGDTASPTEVRGLGGVIGVNQVVFDAPSRVLAAESDALLRQHTRYLLVATDAILDTSGRPARSRASCAIHGPCGQPAAGGVPHAAAAGAAGGENRSGARGERRRRSGRNSP